MLLNKKIVFILFIFVAQIVLAIDCDLSKAMSKISDQKFWEKLGTINTNNPNTLKQLILEFEPNAFLEIQKIATSSVNISKLNLEVTHKAEKAASKLSKINVKHYDDFIKVINEDGVHSLHENPGKWHYEKLPQYGSKAHSARLDSGYRILFDVEKDGVVNIRDIGNHIGH